MFFASDERFGEMDGRLFNRARAIERELKKAVRRKTRHGARQRLPLAV